MSTFRLTLIFLGVLFVLVMLWAWFVNNWEKVPYDAWVGFSGEARTNDYLAAERLLDRLGVATESVANLHDKDGLPSVDGTLFVPVWRSTFSRARIARLQEWVVAGGHLVVIGRMGHEDNAGAGKDELLDPLGVTVDRPDDLDEDHDDIFDDDEEEDVAPLTEGDEQEGATNDLGGSSPGEGVTDLENESTCVKDGDDSTYNGKCDESAKKGGRHILQGELGEQLKWIMGQIKTIETPVRMPDVEKPLTVTGWAEEKEWELIDSEDRAIWGMPGDKHYMLLQLEVGKGVLTILRGASFMTNRLIGEKDNAEFLWRLATWNNRRGDSWIIFGYDVPSLLTVLIDRGGMLLLGLVLLLAFWLWRHVLRFGPLHQLPILPRRSVMEHIDASGRFLWRHGQRRVLVEVVQSALWARAARRIADWQRLDEPDRTERLAQIASLSVEQVRVALSSAVPESRSQFTEWVQRLEMIRRAL
ncbi:MAG: hypothetical protein A2289_17785 [Deltaproteobacteria bacterium RIFOXYA12_FULL_58_15]|nr:MAG: hypothetical protein A2289_17785 [Deltaproteobacteria bacterium RIFOXYA12_FULL_58_15]OGR14571.1 MAG: hypothetical protein A2341_04925 [Deltaproteobacteria bacterium RIFOXYB12_FULL_58_9]